jgi:predicted metalloprotease with PDZ domain
MYEGVTEYFANLFQINQGLITEEDFYNRISDQIERANAMNDTMSFTTMSANVLTQPYKDQYVNVYQKGSLIGMCLDIIIREKSNGERGILDLMQKLSNEYGVSKPFNDDELFAKITALTYPEVGEFLETYVAGTTPIPYDNYFAKVGLSRSTTKIPANVFLKGQKPYITVDPQTKEIIVLPNIELNEFYTSLGLKGGDVILAINDKAYSLENIYDMIGASQNWKEDDAIAVKIKRDGAMQTIKGKVKLPYEEKQLLKATDTSKSQLQEAWLKA